MRLLVLCALIVGVGSLVLIGVLALVRELLSDSVFGVPDFGVPEVSDEQARRDHPDQPQSTSSSVAAIQ
jgi:hypothetical protein